MLSRKAQVSVLFMVVLISTAKATSGLVQTHECTAVTEGSPGFIKFNFKKGITSSPADTFLRVNKDDGPDIIQCFRNKEQSDIECHVQNSQFQSEGWVDDGLILVIQNASQDLQGAYMLRVAFNNTSYDPVSCNFTVLAANDKPRGRVHDHTNIGAIIGGILGCLLLCALIIWHKSRRSQNSLCCRRKRAREPVPAGTIEKTPEDCSTSKETASLMYAGKENERITRCNKTTPPLSTTEKPTISAKPQWIDLNMGADKACEMLSSNGISDGSFLISAFFENPESHLLLVRSGSVVLRFAIIYNEGKCAIEPENRFDNIESLINHYTTVKGCLPRTLVLSRDVQKSSRGVAHVYA